MMIQINMVTWSFLFIIIACSAENKNKDIKYSRSNSEKVHQAVFYRTDGPNIHGAVEKKNFLSDMTLLEAIVANTSDAPTSTEMYEDYTTAEKETTLADLSNTTHFTDATEIGLFSKSAVAITTESPVERNTTERCKGGICNCDLTYNSCDVNCCCDEECSQEEKKTFSHCTHPNKIEDERYCYSKILYFKNNTPSTIHFQSDNIFCILRDNLPDKRNSNHYSKVLSQTEPAKLISNFYKWPEGPPAEKTVFRPKPYYYGDTVWSVNNQTVSVLDIPSPYMSNYCSNRTPVKYLKNVELKCIIKISELEMFAVYKYFKSSILAGLPEKMRNNIEHVDLKNCSNVHCISWTIFACNLFACELFNTTRHSASCTDLKCVNMATKLKYVFHCLGATINKAEVFLYITDISTQEYLLQQEIIVKYYFEKENNTNSLLEMSGNPGYLMDKPIIRLNSPSDGSFSFASNTTSDMMSYLSYPKNVAGACVLSNTTKEVIKFGMNRKSNCRYTYKIPTTKNNGTKACNEIKDELYAFLGFNNEGKAMISPLGNPISISKDEWLEMVSNKPDEKMMHGEYRHNALLVCYNFVSVLTYQFIYANVSLPGVGSTQSDRTILRSYIHHMASERVFDFDENSFVVTTNMLFFDVTKPVIYEYAQGPQLYIHLPSDFFYPFTSGAYNIRGFNLWILSVIYVLHS